MLKNLKTSIVIVLAFVFVLSLASQSDAQTKKRKKRPVKKAPTTAVVPPLYTSEPIIVSRASDYDSDQNKDDVTLEPLQQTAPLTARDQQLADIAARIRSLEKSLKKGYDDKQKTLLMNLDILTRAEQRAESLRKQRFDLVEKENAIQIKLDQLEYDMRPEMIQQNTSMMGSLRPEELRDARRKSLEAERRNLQSLLTDVQNARAALDKSVVAAEDLVERIRGKLEKDIDAAIADDKPDE